MSPARSEPVAGLLPERLPGRAPKGRELRVMLEELVGSLEAGALLPSERVIAARYGVARQTVRGELERMSAEGLTYRVQGSGTFVAEARISVGQTLAMSSFTEEMRSRGLRPGSRLLAQEVVPATPVVARRLEIAEDALAVQIDRVRTADEVPIALERAHLPSARFAGLEDADLASGSLYTLIEERWDVRLREAEQRIVAVILDAREADLLGVAAGQPALRFQTIGRDGDGRVVHYTEALYRSDRYEAVLRQERRDL